MPSTLWLHALRFPYRRGGVGGAMWMKRLDGGTAGSAGVRKTIIHPRAIAYCDQLPYPSSHTFSPPNPTEFPRQAQNALVVTSSPAFTATASATRIKALLRTEATAILVSGGPTFPRIRCPRSCYLPATCSLIFRAGVRDVEQLAFLKLVICVLGGCDVFHRSPVDSPRAVSMFRRNLPRLSPPLCTAWLVFAYCIAETRRFESRNSRSSV